VGRGLWFGINSYYTLAVEKINGEPVTGEMIDRWVDEAERGYDVGELRKRGRKPVGEGPGQVVPVRIDETLLEALASRAAADHVSRSEAIRAAIRAYVA
jgi:Ribbon-helix-helix protein, copG family